MKIPIRHLSHSTVQVGVKWLEEHVSPRKYWLHNQRGGEGWRYHSADRTIEIDDEKTAVMFLLKFGGIGDRTTT